MKSTITDLFPTPGIYSLTAGIPTREPGFGPNFDYNKDKYLLDEKTVKSLLNPENNDRSKAYEKDLTHGKPYFACE